jgi:FMN phosphatase YigB (HAD superfamily)
MPLTLLLDLDDTLLDSNMQDFIPAYFKVLSDTLQDIVPPEIMLPALMGGTRKMMEKKEPERTLQEVFNEYFYKKIDLNRSNVQKKIDLFYDEEFPKLKYLTRQRPDAMEFVKWAFKRNFKVVIATNPLFPLKAIEHRLRWAGLAPENFPFILITSYETSHFTKGNIAYFTEVMGKLGWQDEPVVMVGNDLKMDIEPAIESGLPVYWLTNKESSSPDLPQIPQGRIKDLRTWLLKVPIRDMQHSIDKPSSLLAVLLSTSAVLEGALGANTVELLDFNLLPQEWSITEVLCHLRDVEIEVNIPRIKKILRDGNPFIIGENTDRWADERNYARQSGENALVEFMNVRGETLDILGKLTTEWDRPARHSILGSITLRELVGVMAGHDKNHIRQIHTILEKRLS